MPGIRTYTFRVELLGSRNPPITRTFTLPALSTFQRLHHAIQYSFGWRNSHLHEFTFEPARTERATGLISLSPRTVLMNIGMGEEDYDGFGGGSGRPYFDEKEIKLNDVWEENGKARKSVMKDGKVVSLYYLYDFGDNWDHKIDFVSSGTTSNVPLKVVRATGCGPLDDSGGVRGWDDVKTAFSRSNPNTQQRERKAWARMISPLGRDFDPSKAPSLDLLNKEGEFEKFARLCRQGEGNGEEEDGNSRDTPIAASAFLSQIDPNLDLNSLPHLPPLEGRFSLRVGPTITDGPAKRRFIAQADANPFNLFKPTINACTIPAPRWVHTDNTGKVSVLIFTDGAAPNNGQPNVRAGCGVVFRPDGRASVSFPLEQSREGHAPTSNRAELRAVIAALRMRYWPGEGFNRIVIGTDSEYVVLGICDWVEKWKSRGWRRSKGGQVKNKDLWERLLAEVEKAEGNGLSVQFWHLRREWNVEADKVAKEGAENPDVPNDFVDISVVMA